MIQHLVFDKNFDFVRTKLAEDSKSTNKRFENNYEHLWFKIDDYRIWETRTANSYNHR